MVGPEEFLKRLARHADGPGTGTELPKQAPTEFTTCILARLRDLEPESPWARLAGRAVPVAAAAALLSFAWDILTHRKSSSTTEPETRVARRRYNKLSEERRATRR